MTHEPPRPEDPQRQGRLPDPLTGALEHMVARQHERRERIVQEILANKRGEYRVPTWVLVLALFAMIVAIVIVLAVT